MINTAFEAYKVKREIIRCGTTFEFKRVEVDKFGESTGKKIVVATVSGIYHEQSSFKTIGTNEASKTVMEKKPMLLCLADEVDNLPIKQGDEIEVSVRGFQNTSKTLKYVGYVDIQNWGILVDMSFEEVQNGNA